MLFDVAAISTSVALGPVAEAFGVHEISRQVVVQAAPAVDLAAIVLPDAPPLPFIGPEPATGPLEQVQGGRLLQQLSMLTPATTSSFVEEHRDALAALVATPPAATDVTRWWGSLSGELRSSLRAEAPGVVGNLDGVPYEVRDLANRTELYSTMENLRLIIAAESGRTVVENAKQQLRMLQSISDSLGSTISAPGRTLMSLDVTGQGRAAIILGDLKTADYVTYLVPGMFFTIENQMSDWVDAASRLQDEQLSWLALLKPEGASQSVATIAWIGYPTPNLTNVGGIENAYEGRDSLASAIEGLKSLRSEDEPYVTVVAHSYGSTAALMALTEYDFEIDALAMVGSPGSPAQSVSELHVRDGNVWVGEASWDPIPNSAYFGSDPGAESYGAHPLGVNGATDSITRQQLLASVGHNDYFSAGTESMRNFALIGIGEGQYVMSDEDAQATAAPASDDLLTGLGRLLGLG